MEPIVDTTDVALATDIEANLPPGTYALRIDTDGPVSFAEIQDVVFELENAGVKVKSAEPTDTGLVVTYQKEAAAGISVLPVAIIPLIGMALIVTIIAVGIFNLESITKTLAVVLGGAILLGLVLKGPLTEAAKRL